MKILVTGVAGFIGSHIADRLIKEGHEVVGVDDLSTGVEENLNPNIRFYKIKLQDPQLQQIILRESPDCINHHAAQINVRKSVEDPLYDATSNIIGTINLLESAVKAKVKKIIFASSGGTVYGEQSQPIREDTPFNPESPYGIAKACCEFYIRFYARTYGLKYVILRYSNVYGPRQNPKGEAGVITIFAEKMLRGEPPTIFGDGTQERDYVYVGDVVEANILALTRGDNEAFNIGTGRASSVNEIFRLIKEATNFPGDPIYAPPRPGEVKRNVLDISKAKNLLGWSPQKDLKEGIAETISYLINRHSS